MDAEMLGKIFKSIMDPESNGLSQLSKVVRFQIMIALSFMWSVIFCISAGVFVWLPGYVLVHVVLLLIGIFGTGWVFKSSQGPETDV
jgi:hypothetical protein